MSTTRPDRSGWAQAGGRFHWCFQILKHSPHGAPRVDCSQQRLGTRDGDALRGYGGGADLPIPFPERHGIVEHNGNLSVGGPVKIDKHRIRHHIQKLDAGAISDPFGHLGEGNGLLAGAERLEWEVHPQVRAEQQGRETPAVPAELQLQRLRHGSADRSPFRILSMEIGTDTAIWYCSLDADRYPDQDAENGGDNDNMDAFRLHVGCSADEASRAEGVF